MLSIFDLKGQFVYSLCLVAIFGSFEKLMLSEFKYQLFLGALFWIRQLQRVVKRFLVCFYALLIFDPK